MMRCLFARLITSASKDLDSPRNALTVKSSPMKDKLHAIHALLALFAKMEAQRLHARLIIIVMVTQPILMVSFVS